MARILSITPNPALDLTVRLTDLRLGEVNRSESLNVHAAGKGLNVAQVLADLGHRCTVSGFLGQSNPNDFDALFARRGFVDEFVRVPGETRSNVKLAETGGRVTDINGPGLMASEQAQAMLLARLARVAPGHDAVVVAGSLPRGVGIDWFSELLRMLRQLDIPLAVDTSGAALRAALEVSPWLVKPNEEELASACGATLDSSATLAGEAGRLRDTGIAHVVVSRGAEGVSWFGPEGLLQATPPRVEVVSTVGAGDSLLAGMLHGLLAGWTGERTLRLATAVAAQAVGQIGFGIGDRQQLARLETEVSVQALAPTLTRGAE